METTVMAVMTTDVVTVREQTPFKEIVEVLRLHRVNAVPVLDEQGRVKGIVSTGDLIIKEADPTAVEKERLLASPRQHREWRKSEGSTAAEVMSRPAHTTTPRATVRAAAREMSKHRVSRLPVVSPDTGKLVGIVSRSDLLRVYDRPDAEIERDIRTEIAENKLAPYSTGIEVTVKDGRADVRGEVDRRSRIPALMHDIRRVEGVVSAESHLEWRTDDLTPLHYPYI